VAAGTIAASSLAPANAATITGGGTGVTDFKQGDWVYLISPQGSNPLTGVAILQQLTTTAAQFRIRIDNNLGSNIGITSASFNLLNDNVVDGNGLLSGVQVPTLSTAFTDLTPSTNFFSGGFAINIVPGIPTTTSTNFGASIFSGGAPSLNPIPGTGPTRFDEFSLILTRTGGGNLFVDPTQGISLSNFQLGTFNTSTFQVATINGSFSAVPTPALLPGLIGLAFGAWRKRKQEVTNEEKGLDPEQV
jgi:hypothetical protein